MTIVPRSARLLIAAALAAVSLAAEASVTTYSNRTSFESLGSIGYNYGFDDINTGALGYQHQVNPFTTHGITYSTGGNNLVLDFGIGPTSKVFTSDAPVGSAGYVSGTFADSYSMFGFDLGALTGASLVTISVNTNLGSYSNLFSASAAPAASFLGFGAGAGEYFTSFHIEATTDNAPALDNVTLGVLAAASPIPEPSMLALLLPGLLALGFAARRRNPPARE